METQNLPAPPLVLSAAQAAVNDDSLFIAGLDMSGRPRLLQWDLRAKAPAYRCPKKMISVVGWSSIPVRHVLRHTRPLRPGVRAYLRITLQFPKRATNALQGKTSVLVPRFTAIGGLL